MWSRLLSGVVFMGGAGAGLFSATQWTAHLLRHHKTLGQPLAHGMGWAVYQPWDYVGWYVRWADAPGAWGEAIRQGQWVVLGGMAGGILGALAIRLLCGQKREASTAFGSARWATASDIAKAGLFDE